MWCAWSLCRLNAGMIVWSTSRKDGIVRRNMLRRAPALFRRRGCHPPFFRLTLSHTPEHTHKVWGGSGIRFGFRSLSGREHLRSCPSPPTQGSRAGGGPHQALVQGRAQRALADEERGQRLRLAGPWEPEYGGELQLSASLLTLVAQNSFRKLGGAHVTKHSPVGWGQFRPCLATVSQF